MSINTKLGNDLARGLTIAIVVALVVAGALWWVFSATSDKKVTAYFAAGVGVYEGGDVRVLGVPVGTIDSVTPEPKQVKVEMSVDEDAPIPANPHAVVIAPSVVSDRYIQLDRYTGGPQLADDTVIKASRTATPAELDQVYDTLNELSQKLGPNGVNKRGALTRLLDTGAANLDGNGRALKQTITALGDATRTLNGKQGALFDTVRNLAKFTTALEQSDGQVNELNKRFTDVNQFLADERGNLAQTVQVLGSTLAKVKAFIQDNRASLRSNVANLTSVTRVLVRQRAALTEVLDVGPLALGNVTHVYNSSSGTLDSRPYIPDLDQYPLVALCRGLESGNLQTPDGRDLLPNVLAEACKQVTAGLKGITGTTTLAKILAALQSGSLPTAQKNLLDVLFASLNGGRP